jgi:hypothetical protein
MNTTGNPLDPSPEDLQRIRERAYHLWEADGCPDGRDLEYWERARELDAIASHPGAGQVPVTSADRPEEAVLQRNLGEFPDRLPDQGERMVTPDPAAPSAG